MCAFKQEHSTFAAGITHGVKIKFYVMIKCDVKVSGTICKEAAIRNNKDGKSFLTFSMNVLIPISKESTKAIEIAVTRDDISEDQLANYSVGTRLTASGVLIFKKRGDNVYVNLYAEHFEFNSVPEKDGINGKMKFRGKLGKTVNEKTDKKGKKYFLFSGMSSEKVENGFEYLWVSFFLFKEKTDECLKPEAKVEITGDVEISFFKDKLNITSRVDEITPYVSTYNPSNQQ